MKRFVGPCLAVLLVLLAGLMLLGPHPVEAGRGVWTTSGPYGGYILSLAVSPQYVTDHAVYAGTRFNGVFKTSDRGEEWSPVHTRLSELYRTSTEDQAHSVVMLPDDPTGRSFMIGVGGGAFVTHDGGATWEERNLFGGLCSGKPPEVWGIVLSPTYTQDHTIYAITNMAQVAFGPPGPSQNCFPESIVFKSTDGGERWQFFQVVPTTLSLAVARRGDGRTAVFIGTDQGMTWGIDAGYYLTETTRTLNNYSIRALAVSPDFASDGTVFAGTSDMDPREYSVSEAWTYFPKRQPEAPAAPGAVNATASRERKGVFRSTDGGANWQQVNAGLSDTALDVRALLVSNDINHVIYAGTRAGLYRSTDHGGQWELVDETLNGHAVTSLALGPADAEGVRDIYVGTDGAGVYRSENGGSSWSAQTKGTTDLAINDFAFEPGYSASGSSAAIFAATEGGGIQKLTSDGWGQLVGADIKAYAVAVLPLSQSDNIILAGTAKGLYTSTTQANSWSLVQDGLPPNWPIHVIAYSPADETSYTIFAGSRDGGLFRSTDGGRHWEILSSVAVNAIALSPDFAHDKTLFIGTSWGPMRSTDGGLNWQAHTTGLVFTSVDALAISPTFAEDHTLFAASSDFGLSLFEPNTPGGVARSTDGGLTWTSLQIGNTWFRLGLALAISPMYNQDHTIFLGTGSYDCLCGYGVFRSTDGGDTWDAFNAGLDTRWAMIRALKLSPNYSNDRTLFAGLNNGARILTEIQKDTVRTLVLWPQQRFLKIYSREETEKLKNKLHDLTMASGQDAVAVDGVLLDVTDGTHEDVDRAYAAWEAAPTTANANAVASAVQAVIAQQAQQYPNLEYLVLVGADTMIPFYREADGTDYPERNYLRTANLPPPGVITASVSTALNDNMTLSDAPYGRLGALPDARELAVGRLVETPTEIITQVTTFTRFLVIKDAHNAVVGGNVDYLMDAAPLMADDLSTRAHLSTTTALGTAWSTDKVRDDMLVSLPDVAVILARTTHNSVATADSILDTTAVTTSLPDKPSSSHLILSLGDHSGLSVPDNKGVVRPDLPQAIAGRGVTLVAPTGYAWAQRDVVGLSEALGLAFLEALGRQPSASTGPITVGQALREARTQLRLASRAWNDYDAKVADQLTLYGLPMLAFHWSLGQPLQRAGASKVEPSVRLQTPQDSTPIIISDMNRVIYLWENLGEYEPHRGSAGDYYSYAGLLNIHAAPGYPILPRLTWATYNTLADGAVPRGTLFLGGRYTSETMTPLVASPVVAEANQARPLNSWGGWYPSIPQALNVASNQQTQLVLALTSAQRLSATSVQERRLTQARFEVIYSTHAASAPPTLSAPSVQWEGSNIRVHVQASSATGVQRVLVTYTAGPNAQGIGVWQSVELQRQGDEWVGLLPTAQPVTYLVQAVGASDAVAVDDNNGQYYSTP